MDFSNIFRRSFNRPKRKYIFKPHPQPPPLFGSFLKLLDPIFDSSFQINTLQGLERKSCWLLTVILPNYVLQCCYASKGEKYDSSSKITGSGYDVVIRLMKMTPSIYRSTFQNLCCSCLLPKDHSFLTRNMCQNDALHHLLNEVSSAKSKSKTENLF